MDERSLNALHDTESMSVDVLVDGGSGDSLFVINLCAANVPQAIDASSVQEWGIAGIHRYKLYQVSRMEDGRRRYRVRLGFFSSEAAAELVLQTVRGKFASAFSSCLADEDLKHASGYLKRPLHEIQEIQDLQRTGRYRLPKIDTDKSQKVRSPFVAERTASSSDTQRVPALKPRASTEVTADHTSLTKVAAITDKLMENSVVEFEWSPPSKAKPVAPTKAAPTPIQKSSPAVKKSVPTSKPRSPAPLHIEEIPLTPPPTKTSTSGQYHVASGRDIPDFGLSLSDVHATHEKSAARPPTKKPANELPKPLVSAEALAKLRAAAQPRNQPAVIPTLDSTQTIRTLTKNEVEDANAARWYVVQLAVSDQPANLDTMPRLDIFEAYRLYSVATMDGAVIRHALRLGFFREEVSAEAVLGYL
ncbi:MAG TPA: hypothetical protein VET48_10985, partial [Steroidobacteraceae bacterium]|nr:hypothetical protein [Steroidobacteraceae bacterium]